MFAGPAGGPVPAGGEQRHAAGRQPGGGLPAGGPKGLGGLEGFGGQGFHGSMSWFSHRPGRVPTTGFTSTELPWGPLLQVLRNPGRIVYHPKPGVCTQNRCSGWSVWYFETLHGAWHCEMSWFSRPGEFHRV